MVVVVKVEEVMSSGGCGMEGGGWRGVIAVEGKVNGLGV